MAGWDRWFATGSPELVQGLVLWAGGSAGAAAGPLLPQRPEPFHVLCRAAVLLLLFDFVSNEGY